MSWKNGQTRSGASPRTERRRRARRPGRTWLDGAPSAFRSDDSVHRQAPVAADAAERPLRQGVQVVARHVLDAAVRLDRAVVDPDGPAAEAGDRRHVVADEEHGAAARRRPRPSCRGTSSGSAASPTASTSSTRRISGSRCAATAKASRMYMPRRVVLDGGVDELLDLGERDDLVELPVDLGLAHAEDGAVQVRRSRGPSARGGSRCPTSSSEPTRPWISARPVVGGVIRDRIFSSVLLPAPLRPMMPTTSPAPHLERDVLEGPENVVLGSSRSCEPTHAADTGAATVLHERVAERRSSAPGADRARTSCRAARRGSPFRISFSDDIGEDPLHAAEVEHPGDEDHRGHDRARGDQRSRARRARRGAPNGSPRRRPPSG